MKKKMRNFDEYGAIDEASWNALHCIYSGGRWVCYTVRANVITIGLPGTTRAGKSPTGDKGPDQRDEGEQQTPV